MDLVLYTNNVDEYLKHDNVIDYDNEAIAEQADALFQKADNELDFMKKPMNLSEITFPIRQI